MTEPQRAPDRQRRTIAYVFLAVAVVDLIVGIVAGAAFTIAAGVFLLVVGGALLGSVLFGKGAQPPG